jgi:hypothetical protein
MMKDDVYQQLDISNKQPQTNKEEEDKKKKKKKYRKNFLENGRHCRIKMTPRISPNCVGFFRIFVSLAIDMLCQQLLLGFQSRRKE